MIKTDFYLEDISPLWIFEYYCQLPEKLHGQDVRIKSKFNPEEQNNSMFIFYKDDRYLFKDFSTGNGGDAVTLVMNLFKLSYLNALAKIKSDYKKYQINNTYVEEKIKPESKFQITTFEKRKWNVLDQKYWTQFNIGSELLEEYNVYPLKSFVFSKNVDNKIIDIKNEANYTYGYFKSDGTLGKIYKPHSKSLKFINVNSFIQGADQLNYEKDNLIICASMKDGLALASLDLNVEFIAPSSENTTIPRNFLSALSLKYKYIYTLFDNDNAGYIAAQKYIERYNIPGLCLNLSKDIADSIVDHGPKIVKNHLKIIIPTL